MSRTREPLRRFGPIAIVGAAVVLIALVLLRVPLVSILFLGVLLLCPLLMRGMHGSGEGHQGSTSHDSALPPGAEARKHEHGSGAAPDAARPSA